MATLLILDRERRSRRELYALLATRYRVIAVHGIFAAFRLLRRHALDLVLVKTSGMDAFAMALLRWFQLQGWRTPTVVLVGRGASRDANVIRQLGASAVLRWPTAGTELLRAVAAASESPQHNGAEPVIHRKLVVLPATTEAAAVSGGTERASKRGGPHRGYGSAFCAAHN
jgi:DNA-binding response OmpR family regulator